MRESLRQQDVERILRDVLSSYGVRVSVMQVEQAPNGWRVEVTDVANRVVAQTSPMVRRSSAPR